MDVTVIISVYRELAYVEKCINSLINQTFQSFEFILIDDCGGDGAFEKARNLTENSILADRTRYIVHQRNMGIASSRNTGMAAATGKYMIYLDSDDFFEPDLLEELYNAAVRHDADLVISDFIREMPGGVSVYSKDTFDQDLITEFADKERYIKEMLTSVKGCAPWNKLVKRELYINNNISFHDNMRDDLSVTPLLVWHATRIAFVHKALTHFVQYNTASGTFSFNHLPFVGNALVHLETFFKSKGMDYTDVFLRYKANTKRKILMHPKPEMTQEQMFGLFPEVDSAIRNGERLEPKIQYQMVLKLASMRNKNLFRIYRKSLLVLLKASSLVSQ
ncbi:MAG: glycosyltransferase family 2 protein [Bacteroidales bacterium]|jgi:glycosyltransferase involved in cell wall biosynthesis